MLNHAPVSVLNICSVRFEVSYAFRSYLHLLLDYLVTLSSERLNSFLSFLVAKIRVSVGLEIGYRKRLAYVFTSFESSHSLFVYARSLPLSLPLLTPPHL